MDLPFSLTVIQYVLLCHSFIKRKLLSHQLPIFFLSFLPCASAGTLSVCVNEKLANPLLHTVALQFLCAVFTEETKSLGAEVTTSGHATALSDIVKGPSAAVMCLSEPGADWPDRRPKTAVDYSGGSAHAGYQRIRSEP